jgi:hypothetical protein
MENGGWIVQKLDGSSTPPKVISKKYVTTTDVASLFFKTTSFDTGFLDKKIIRYARSAELDIWTLVIPGLVRPIIHYARENDEDSNTLKTSATWMPPSLWIIKTPIGATKKWEARVFLVDMKTGKTGHYPSPNVHGDGAICWGHTLDTRPPMLFPRDCNKVPDIFFGSEFNNDLWSYSDATFGQVVKAMAAKKVIEEMNDDERFAKLLSVLPSIYLDTTLESTYKSVVREG